MNLPIQLSLFPALRDPDEFTHLVISCRYSAKGECCEPRHPPSAAFASSFLSCDAPTGSVAQAEARGVDTRSPIHSEGFGLISAPCLVFIIFMRGFQVRVWACVWLGGVDARCGKTVAVPRGRGNHQLLDFVVSRRHPLTLPSLLLPVLNHPSRISVSLMPLSYSSR